MLKLTDKGKEFRKTLEGYTLTEFNIVKKLGVLPVPKYYQEVLKAPIYKASIDYLKQKGLIEGE